MLFMYQAYHEVDYDCDTMYLCLSFLLQTLLKLNTFHHVHSNSKQCILISSNKHAHMQEV